MKASLEFVAKPGCEDQINQAYAKRTGKRKDWLVHSEAVILAEIAYMNSPEGQNHRSHLRASLQSVEDWNVCFPDYALGSGSIPLVATRNADGASIKRDIQFVYEHQLLFKSIEGLETAMALWHPNLGVPRSLRSNRKVA